MISTRNTPDATLPPGLHAAGGDAAHLIQTLLNATTNSAFLIDADGFFLAANEIGARRLGRSAEEMVGRNARTLVPWDVFERRMLKVHDVICTQRPLRFEDERQGTYFDNLFSPVLDSAGRVACVAMFAEVITDVKKARSSLQLALDQMETRVLERTRELREANETLKQEIRHRSKAEAALRESEIRFRQLVDNIDDVFWLTEIGPPLRVLYASPAFETIWGLPLQSLYADPDVWLQSIHEKDRGILARAFDEFMRNGGEFEAEFRIIRPDGAIRWILDRGTPVYDERGRAARLAGVAQDITARKRVERHQEDLVEELRQFSYIISHDLRAPLINLKGFSGEIRLALEEITPALGRCRDFLEATDRRGLDLAVNEDLPEALSFIESSVSRMEGMINAILRLSRAGRRPSAPEALNMAALTEEVLDCFAFQVQQSGITVRVGDLPDVQADRMDMEQVLANLIGNAVQYLDPDRPGFIEIDGRVLFDEVRFKVRDNGIGMAPDLVERIFDLFYRIGERKTPGEGMGLAYVRAVVRRHGGRIWCESIPGSGSSFYFTIPLTRPRIDKGDANGKP